MDTIFRFLISTSFYFLQPCIKRYLVLQILKIVHPGLAQFFFLLSVIYTPFLTSCKIKMKPASPSLATCSCYADGIRSSNRAFDISPTDGSHFSCRSHISKWCFLHIIRLVLNYDSPYQIKSS